MALAENKISSEKAIYLIGQVFKDLNSLKRDMTLEESDKSRGHYEAGKTHELNKYKRLLSLELNLRGLQSELRSNEAEVIELNNRK